AEDERIMLGVFGAVIVVLGIGIYAFAAGAGEHGREELAGHALRYFYIFSAFLFILGLKGLSSPRYARRGMFLAEFGLVLALACTLFHPEIKSYQWLIVGMVIGTVVGGGMGLQIPMTAVPQRTALSHSLGALA